MTISDKSTAANCPRGQLLGLGLLRRRRVTGLRRCNHFRIALGSAAETCSVLDYLALPEALEQQQKLRRVGAMTARLSRR